MQVKCWGDNTQGTLGLGDSSARGTHRVPPGRNAGHPGRTAPPIQLVKCALLLQLPHWNWKKRKGFRKLLCQGPRNP
eukprot:3146838-Amphidinium_carterae.1